MLTKASGEGERGLWLGLAILALGFLLGQLVDPSAWLERRDPDAPGNGSSLVRPTGPFGDDAGVEAQDNGLATLELELPGASVEKLSALRETALARGLIERTDDDLVPLAVTAGERTVQAEARLKGDAALDHVDSDKWSLRIELDEPLLGMTRFSIQHPKVRRYLWEWLTLAAARHEGLLAPRSQFVNVVINGRPNGVYYLEEHFSTTMIEAQGRREGPIVRFREEVFWATLGHNRSLELRDRPSDVVAGNAAHVAEIEAYGEKKLVQGDATSRQLYSALEKLRETQRQIVAESADAVRFRAPGRRGGQTNLVERREKEMRADWLARVHALTAQRAAGVEELFHMEGCARQAAFMSLFQGSHGMIWHNMRFYHDPVRNRLEPLVFDTGSGGLGASGVDDPIWSGSQVGVLWSTSPRFELAAYRELARLTEPAWIDELERDLGPALLQNEAALAAEELLPESQAASALWEHLRYRQLHLHDFLRQPEPAAFFCRVVGAGEEFMSGTLAVEAWSTTRVPVRLEGFQFSNGRRVKAADVVRTEDPDVLREGDAVVLPSDSRRVLFEFPIDHRLATLHEVDQLTEAVKQQAERERDVRLALSVLYAPVGSDEVREKQLPIRQHDASWEAEGGRPEPPELEEALARHACLDYDLESARLSLRPGTWTLDDDLLVPRGVVLRAGPGVHLRFARGKALISSSALEFTGTPDDPVVIEPLEGVGNFGGVIVVDAAEESRWENVVVHRAGEMRRGGWVTTGGVTFYRSAVRMLDCRVERARGEDALNIVGASFVLDGVDFFGSVSDAFDGDFVRGQVVDCTFRQIGADGVDTSGSDVAVERCTFVEIGDKAISAGEDSRLSATACTVIGSSIGVASKDRSSVTCQDLRLQDVRNYGLTAYIKKDEFGPSDIDVTGVTAEGVGLGLILAQTGCRVTVDGETAPTVDLDVKKLYREKILGQ